MKSRFYTPQALGAKRTMTPEGYLVCHDVPIARTGMMLYAAGEVPVEGDNVGEVRIERVADEVFRAETMASFEGKPVTIEHPPEFVNPQNFHTYARGVVQNVRRGSGVEDDYLFADLVIHSQEAIDAVNSGTREVSCGYEADYEQTEPGRGVQRNIIGNHVALVERGRCGPRCAIGDQQTMTPKQKKSILDRVTAIFNDDAQEAENVGQRNKEAQEKTEQSEAVKDAVRDAMKPVVDALAGINTSLASIQKYIDSMESGSTSTETGPDNGSEENTEDTVIAAEEAAKLDQAGAQFFTGDAIAEVTRALAIIAPDMKVPTFDSAATAKTIDAAMCACQRKALEHSRVHDWNTPGVKELIAGIKVADLSPAKLHTLFMRVTDRIAAANNKRVSDAVLSTRAIDAAREVANTVEAINEANRKHWKRS
ncbi:MAG: DUF2213 domain-containing protein [Rhodospirillales bacterium]|nr:DUF2213 domain-containing protein [Rhodospirillales bacterium]